MKPKEIIEKIKRKIKELWEHRKCKLHLYYNGVIIKVLKVGINEEPAKKNYAIKVFNKKFLFGNTVASVVVKPVVLLKTDEEKHKSHWGVILDPGVEIK